MRSEQGNYAKRDTNFFLLHMTEKNKEHFTEDSHAEKTKRQQNNLLNGK